ncbi:putative F-box protein PP2-B12 [Lycium ferocissimum]|uniref:putative F-box protein PP2-B12 n=1 Tax=Lycium ferocissimum TaxID=112874 RepID=UPI002814C278|nr:putative F-box protein PP2-B12 [Lycium ferocissimum]
MENLNGEYERTTTLLMLPEDCTDKILAFISPLDVCHLSLVSKSVQSVADSDSVWEKFLPSDYQSIIDVSLNPNANFPLKKKDLFVYLYHNDHLIDGGRKIFSLEKWTGKKCYFSGARDLNITWGDTPKYWKWTSLQSPGLPLFQQIFTFVKLLLMFREVAELISVWWLEIRGTIRAGVLSPQTFYTSYLVYKLEDEYGFHHKPSEVSVEVSGVEFDKRFVFLMPEGRAVYIPPISVAEDESGQPDDDYEELVYPLPSGAEDEPGQPDDYAESVYTLPSDVEDDPGLADDDCEVSVYSPSSDAEEEPGQPDDDYEESVYILPFDAEDEPRRPDYDWWGQRFPEVAFIQRPKLRDDGWFEVELGEFYTQNEDDCIEMSLKEVKDCVSQKQGLIVEGIEIRPSIITFF